MLSDISQAKINTVFFHLQVEFKNKTKKMKTGTDFDCVSLFYDRVNHF